MQAGIKATRVCEKVGLAFTGDSSQQENWGGISSSATDTPVH